MVQSDSCLFFKFITADIIEIVEHPNSLLIPANQTATISCVANCTFPCTGRWLINGSYTHPFGRELNQLFVDKGFWFPSPVQDETHGNKHTITMMVNASQAVDNTIITCEFGDGVVSENATLLVISGESVYSSIVYIEAWNR